MVLKSSNLALLFCVTGVFVVGLVACQALHPHPGTAAIPSPAPSAVPDEVSLKSDRQQYDTERKNIPPEQRKENDELAFVRELMADGDREPSEVRERFSKAVREKRERFDKIAHKERDEWDKQKKTQREAFLLKQKEEREHFSASKDHLDAAKRKDFYEQQDSKRQAFFADEHDRTKDFESRSGDARKDFEAYVNEKTNHFNQEMRDYATLYYERKKQVDLKKRSDEKAQERAREKAREDARHAPGALAPGAAVEPGGASGSSNSELEEFKTIPKTPGTPLGPSDDGK